jgi:hypothetical protein
MWQVIFDQDFETWIREQPEQVITHILASVGVLQQLGPNLGRPHVDTVKGSEYKNMKELRVQIAGEPWRVLFAFDPERVAILLLGGCKAADKRWYKKNVPVADARFGRHLEGLKNRKDD